MGLTVGRIVHYRLTDDDAVKINRRRTSGASIAERIAISQWPLGAQAHIGGTARGGDVLPMMIVAVCTGDAHGVNGQVFLAGNDTLWAPSLSEGTEPCQWSWPPKA